MIRKLLTASVLIAPLAALACGGAPAVPAVPTPAGSAPSAASTLRDRSVDEVASLTAAKKVTVVDVNGAETRAKLGVIPGAVLLSGTEFATTELPADKTKPVVFYCGSLQCGASHKAASRAASNGWTDVAVLPVGIKGWVDAGKPTQKI